MKNAVIPRLLLRKMSGVEAEFSLVEALHAAFAGIDFAEFNLFPTLKVFLPELEAMRIVGCLERGQIAIFHPATVPILARALDDLRQYENDPATLPKDQVRQLWVQAMHRVEKSSWWTDLLEIAHAEGSEGRWMVADPQDAAA